MPGPDSWAWRAFPAGDRWKELVGLHGEKAVDAMVERSNPRFHSAFASDHSIQTFDNDEEEKDLLLRSDL